MKVIKKVKFQIFVHISCKAENINISFLAAQFSSYLFAEAAETNFAHYCECQCEGVFCGGLVSCPFGFHALSPVHAGLG